MSNGPVLNLGGWCTIDGMASGSALHLPARHLVTYAVLVGMTGSGKSGVPPQYPELQESGTRV